MTLSKTAFWAIKGMDGESKQRLADRMGITVNRLYYWIKMKSDNFTKAANIQILREELGLTESEILESKVQPQAA